MNYCLDTNIISYFLKNNQEVIDNILKHDITNLSTTTITQLELLYGAYNSKKIEENLSKIRNLIDQLTIYNLDSETIEIIAKEKVKLKQQGQIIEDFDLMIAAICLANNLVLVTNNIKHFKRIKGLKVEDWSR